MSPVPLMLTYLGVSLLQITICYFLLPFWCVRWMTIKKSYGTDVSHALLKFKELQMVLVLIIPIITFVVQFFILIVLPILTFSEISKNAVNGKIFVDGSYNSVFALFAACGISIIVSLISLFTIKKWKLLKTTHPLKKMYAHPLISEAMIDKTDEPYFTIRTVMIYLNVQALMVIPFVVFCGFSVLFLGI